MPPQRPKKVWTTMIKLCKSCQLSKTDHLLLWTQSIIIIRIMIIIIFFNQWRSGGHLKVWYDKTKIPPKKLSYCVKHLKINQHLNYLLLLLSVSLIFNALPQQQQRLSVNIDTYILEKAQLFTSRDWVKFTTSWSTWLYYMSCKWLHSVFLTCITTFSWIGAKGSNPYRQWCCFASHGLHLARRRKWRMQTMKVSKHWKNEKKKNSDCFIR